MYESELKGPNRRGRPLGRWKDRVEEYLGERGINGRGVLKQEGGSVGVERGRDSSSMATLLGGRSRMEQGVRAIDRQIDLT